MYRLLYLTTRFNREAAANRYGRPEEHHPEPAPLPHAAGYGVHRHYRAWLGKEPPAGHCYRRVGPSSRMSPLLSRYEDKYALKKFALNGTIKEQAAALTGDTALQGTGECAP